MIIILSDHTARERQTAVTAYVEIEQLLLFVFELQDTFLSSSNDILTAVKKDKQQKQRKKKKKEKQFAFV